MIEEIYEMIDRRCAVLNINASAKITILNLTVDQLLDDNAKRVRGGYRAMEVTISGWDFQRWCNLERVKFFIGERLNNPYKGDENWFDNWLYNVCKKQYDDNEEKFLKIEEGFENKTLINH